MNNTDFLPFLQIFNFWIEIQKCMFFIPTWYTTGTLIKRLICKVLPLRVVFYWSCWNHISVGSLVWASGLVKLSTPGHHVYSAWADSQAGRLSICPLCISPVYLCGGKRLCSQSYLSSCSSAPYYNRSLCSFQMYAYGSVMDLKSPWN